MLLFVNCCVRDCSRTKRLADRLLSGLDGDVKEIRLSEVSFPVADEAFLKHRDSLIMSGSYDDPLFAMARDFAAADTIVIAAPYWDLSFPAALKQYIEQINVIGLTFGYTAEGERIGLCRAAKLYYVTTAGGMIESDEYGFGYFRTLAQGFYGIPCAVQIKAEGLDLYGADEEAILLSAEAEIDRLFSENE